MVGMILGRCSQYFRGAGLAIEGAGACAGPEFYKTLELSVVGKHPGFPDPLSSISVLEFPHSPLPDA